MATTGSLSNTTTTRKDGLRVDKGIEPGDDQIRVHYRITNQREGDAAIRVEESLASTFPMDALDLDAGGGGDWLLDGASARVALVDIVAAGEAVTTGYVVRCEDPEAVRSVVDAPEIDMVDPVGDDACGGSDRVGDDASGVSDRVGDDRSPEASQAAVAGAVDAAAVANALDAAAVADALDADAVAAAVDEAALADALDPADVASALDADDVVDALDEHAVAEALPDGALVDALAADLAADALTEAHVDTLREHLAPAFSRSDDVRFDRLRARLDDFAAYADGLEAIIDEHGTATELVDSLRRDVDATAADLDAVEDRLGTLAE